MNEMYPKSYGINKAIYAIVFCFTLSMFNAGAQVPDPDLGKRASWLRGSWGLNWKPGRSYNGASESDNFAIDHFLDQISHLKTLDYIQIHLNESSIYSPVHVAPHPLIESFWEGDTDENGDLLNLVVPREDIGRDPFLDIINDIRDAGLKVQVYVNSFNLLNRNEPDDPPTAFPDITDRWKEWCDTNTEAQAFINSQPYHDYAEYPNRKYMFCYAEFVLKVYAERYGNLIDAWCFDSGRAIWQYSGDVVDSDDVEDQRLYQAFADAVHSGNPNASVAFQNSPGNREPLNPFTPATLFDDYMFGHPFNGGQNVGSNSANQWLIDWSVARNGYAHLDDPEKTTRTWDDYVVAHYDPPMSSNQWNTGSTPGVADEVFAEYYGKLLLGGGAVSLGVSLVGRYNFDKNLLAQDWTIVQMDLLDQYLLENQTNATNNSTSIAIESATVRLDVGQTKQLKFFISPSTVSETTINWSSDNTSIATVSSSGLIMAQSAGKTTVSATTANGFIDTVTVIVQSTDSDALVHITKSNAPDYALDGGNGGSNGQDVYLYSSDESNINQQWVEIDRGDGYYSYQKQGTDYCVDGSDGGANGQNVYLWTCDESNYNQQWEKVEVGDGTYKLIKRNAPGFAINGGAGGANQQSVNLWNSSSTSGNLNWFITSIEETSSAKTAKEASKLISTEGGLSVYPNPVTSKVTIQGAENATVRIYDFNSRLVLSRTVKNEIETIDLSTLQTGLYFAEISGVDTKVIKLVKQ